MSFCSLFLKLEAADILGQGGFFQIIFHTYSQSMCGLSRLYFQYEKVTLLTINQFQDFKYFVFTSLSRVQKEHSQLVSTYFSANSSWYPCKTGKFSVALGEGTSLLMSFAGNHMERFSDTRRMHFPASVLIKTHFTGYVPLLNEHLTRTL